MTDARTPLVNQILDANPSAYEKLTIPKNTPELARKLLGGVTADKLRTAASKHSSDAQAMLAGLWLWHDALEEAHLISQSLDNPTGSYWHAIVHRREGDFSNSKYWYARTAAHPANAILATQAAAIVHQYPADKRLLRLVATGWNSSAFVDLVESVYQSPADSLFPLAVELQKLEWRTLFELCARGE